MEFRRVLFRSWPWKLSEGAVRKTRSLSFRVVSSGEVAEGEIITTPAGMLTVLAAARVSPEQKGPTMATTCSTFTTLAAASVPPCWLQAESPTTATSFLRSEEHQSELQSL